MTAVTAVKTNNSIKRQPTDLGERFGPNTKMRSEKNGKLASNRVTTRTTATDQVGTNPGMGFDSAKNQPARDWVMARAHSAIRPPGKTPKTRTASAFTD